MPPLLALAEELQAEHLALKSQAEEHLALKSQAEEHLALKSQAEEHLALKSQAEEHLVPQRYQKYLYQKPSPYYIVTWSLVHQSHLLKEKQKLLLPIQLPTLLRYREKRETKVVKMHQKNVELKML
jgi:hypothetical protein